MDRPDLPLGGRGYSHAVSSLAEEPGTTTGGANGRPATMNASNRTPEDDALSKVLRQTGRTPELPSGFKEEVWRRLTRQSRPESATFSTGWMEFLIGLLYRPAFAAAALALLLSAGAATGYLSAARASREHAAERYTAAVNPFERLSP